MKTKQDLLKKIESGVLQTAPWQKPLVLLIEDGAVYNDVFGNTEIIGIPDHSCIVANIEVLNGD